jgi:predicted regulator of Ras-like GTPase activity (Roadblock/LC7/MglB family)
MPVDGRGGDGSVTGKAARAGVREAPRRRWLRDRRIRTKVGREIVAADTGVTEALQTFTELGPPQWPAVLNSRVGGGAEILLSERLQGVVTSSQPGARLAAFSSRLASLTSGAAKLMGADPVEQKVTEMAGGYLIVMAIGDGFILTVLATKHCELGQVSYEMAMLTKRVGATLTPDPRQPQHQ